MLFEPFKPSDPSGRSAPAEGDSRRIVGSPPGAPPPVGPYSPGVLAGGWLYLSGQIALMEDGTLVPGGVDAEARLVFERLGRMLSMAGATPAHVVKVTLYLTDMASFQTVNAACASFFFEPYPARVTVGVRELPRGANLEVDVVAYLGSGEHL